ncbi:hypothetical protein [Sandarakinorhabdus sp.]|uniref:hypothetical protein n=1 Tax=Sandarakinorhabdus sp. TaxID=1916663 RepID=UPI00286DF220|nr:hypothetical protein [Sandarakinorhabdus sp.]
MSTPDRIDIIAAAALQGYLAQWPLGLQRPTGDAMADLARWALEFGHRYHALRQPGPVPVADPPSPPPTRTDVNVVPICGGLGELKAVQVMGPIS